MGGLFLSCRRARGDGQRRFYTASARLARVTFAPNGLTPKAGVTFDKSGNLYGTTELGGSLHSQGGGTVYKLSPGPTGWTETLLQAGSTFGSGVPLGTVSFDPLGNLYTTFSAGGNIGGGGILGLGSQGGAAEFYFSGTNGYTPAAGVLIDARRAALYGTTSIGGTGQGNVFEMVSPTEETVLYDFCSQPNCADGDEPLASLIEDASGNLYGTTKFGGGSSNCDNGCGVVFEIVQSLPKQKASERPPVWQTILPPKQ
jgi:uncharacterized repeat protein (TIGR03803 family)